MRPRFSPLFLLVLMTLFHFCFSNQNFNGHLCIDDERQALLEFKRGLIDEGGRLASWVGEESDCCKWVGIACDNSTGHVHRIHLPGFDGHCDGPEFIYSWYEVYRYKKDSKLHSRLRGDLNPSLLRLKQLRHLDLSCNNFEGIQVPSFISSLEELRYLNLSYSGFGGVIPSQLGNLSKLHTLSLGNKHNEYTYDVYESTMTSNMQWLSRLRLLTHLDMNRVNLSRTSDWVQVINTLPSLVELYMSDCSLSYIDIDPHVSIHNLTSLTFLDLSENDFNSFVPRWIFSITSLVSLDLSWCTFHSPFPSSISTCMFCNLTSLRFLYVKGNDFMNSSSVLKGLSGSNLILLDISSCGISSSVLDSLHNLTSLHSLDLSENQLTKTIPKSLGNLCGLRVLHLSDMKSLQNSLTHILQSFFECKSPALETLDLSVMGLSGHIPYQIGKLVHLKYMYLDYNQIVGTIPDSIGQLTFMKELSLSRNLISGPIPFLIGRLLSLELLYLSHNRLNDNILDSLSQLSKLICLDFSYNFMKGVVLEAHFDKLVNLKYLNGKGNYLTLKPRHSNWIPPFQLYNLYLNSWGLGPRFPSWIQLQKDLTELDISNTSISEYMPESFWRSFANLNCLDMSQNRIQGTLSSIPSTLSLLDLSYNEFGGELSQLSDGKFPISLDLSGNFFEGSLHHLLCSNGEKETQALDLGTNNFSGVIPECWEKWPRLRYLNLNNNNFSGGIPSTLGSLSSLGALSMSGNNLSGGLPDSLMNLTGLGILGLGRNELVGSIPRWLGTELPYLRLLNLRSNNFHGNIPRELCYLTSIQILDLADNNLSGYIPRCISNFSVLSGKENTLDDAFAFYVVYGGATVASDLMVTKGRQDTYSSILQWMMLLDLSCNNLFGNIPSELTTLVMLRSLNLSRNHLTGSIPDTIGNLKKLESFDLSLNKLSGEIPVSLSYMSFLSSFNVSYNNLTGIIPSGTQLQGFNESSFFGNKLCGPPLIEHCEVEVPGTGDGNEEEGSREMEWDLIISTFLGLVVGFWIVVAPLVVNKSWRIAYFSFFSKLLRKCSY